MKLVVYIVFLLTFLTGATSESCTKINDFEGTINDHLKAKLEERCWFVEVPFNFFVSVDILLESENYDYTGVEITEVNTGTKQTIRRLEELLFQSNIKIIHYVRNYGWQEFRSKLELSFEISKFPFRGVANPFKKAASWLKEHQRDLEENTPRTIIALFLASVMNFRGLNTEENLMTTQLALETTIALLRSPITSNKLSLLVNALLVSCYNPRHFYGKNLVKLLKTQVQETSGFTHPMAYLALCNANETWPDKALNDLNNILSTDSDYPFITDIQAIAILALSCLKKSSNIIIEASNTSVLYNETISRLKSFQQDDGSFGNSHTTALIAQVLISDDEKIELTFRTTIEYLVRELESSSLNFLTVYLILPILNKQTLADISDTKCLSNPMNHEEDIVAEINNQAGPKIRVRYSLYIGEEKDVIHTISLRVLENFTAYDVMKMARIEDQKYKFEVQTLAGKVYVYKIANIPNDPVAGKFWLQYISSTNNTLNLTHFTTNLDEMPMNNGQHLVMWFKTANI